MEKIVQARQQTVTIIKKNVLIQNNVKDLAEKVCMDGAMLRKQRQRLLNSPYLIQT